MMQDFLQYGFLERALVAALLLSVTCGMLSPFIVLRRLSFSADGLAHASLGGLALGIFVLNSGMTPTLAGYGISFLFTCGIAGAIAYFSGSKRMQSDTAVGACYVAAFATGILLLTLRNRSTGHLEHFFFGSILAVNPLECWLLGVLALLTILFCITQWRRLEQWTFDEELAQASGVNTVWLRYALVMLIAATVILAAKVVGVLLATALLILPGAIGTLSGRNMPFIVFLSMDAAIGCATTGMMISNSVNVPPGPVIVLLVFMCFLVAFFLRRSRDLQKSKHGFSTTMTNL
jgi:zinc transport system permease protein